MSLDRLPPTADRTLLRRVIALSVLAMLAARPAEGLAASHREAPRIAMDPTADNTDVYAFVNRDRPGTVTIAMAYYPLEEPAGGPSFFGFDDSVLYEIRIDTDQDAREDLKYEFRFRTDIRPGTGAFVYGGTSAPQPITALSGPGSEGLGAVQTYTVTFARAVGGKFKKRDHIDLGLATMVVTPPRIGGVTTPAYPSLVQQATYALANGGRVFVGPRDDAFYFDLGAVFDSLNLRRNPPVLTAAEDADDAINAFGVDSLAGFNVHAIALELPIGEITDDPDAVIGVWATASRPQRTARKGAPKLGKKDDRDDLHKTKGAFVQVSRMGNPLTSKLILDVLDKDVANATVPMSDAVRIGSFLSPGILPRLAAVLGMSVPTANRTDLVATFLKYPGHDPSVCTEASPCADILRLDLGVPPADPTMQSRLGALGGDPAGFPNGRRVFDDVADIVLRSLASVPVRVGDGVNANDVAFSDSFPYLATPHEGRDHPHGPCPSPSTPTSAPSPAPTPPPTPVATAVPPPTATPTATSNPTPSPTPSASPAPTSAAFLCTGIHVIPDPDNPTTGHVFDGGVCSQTMAELRFVITSGSTYTSFAVPMPSAEFSSTNQPGDTVVATNPSPSVDKRMIAGAKFTTAGPNPHTIVVTAQSFTGQTSQQTVTVPAP